MAVFFSCRLADVRGDDVDALTLDHFRKCRRLAAAVPLARGVPRERMACV